MWLEKMKCAVSQCYVQSDSSAK